MMKVLAIETSGPVGGIAFVEGDRVLTERTFEKGMVHGRDLAPSIAAASQELNLALNDLDLVAVDIGPGSYTGLRVGLAAAKGLCLVLGKPLLGIVSLDVMAESARSAASGLLCPAINAKWDLIYGALYRERRISELMAEKPAEFVHRIPPDAVVFGSALDRFGELFGDRRRLGPEFSHPRPAQVGILAAREYGAGRRDDAMALVPLYLKRTEAEIRAERKGDGDERESRLGGD